MFHKEDSSVLSKNKKSVDVALRKSDRRALRTVAGKLFPHDDPQVLDAVFLQGTLVQRKVMQPMSGRIQLYFRSPSHEQEGSLWPHRTTTQCVWMSLDAGPNQLIHAPTVALLALLPNFPTVEVPWQVSKFLCRGAQLMRSGMRSISIPSETRDGIVAIRAHGNPQPLGVGRLTENTTPQTIGIHTKGVGVNVWTCYGDDLWKQALSQISTDGVINPIGGACYDNGHYGNVGFLEGKVVKPIVAIDDSDDDSEEEEYDEPDESSGDASLTALQNVDDSVPSSQPQQNEQGMETKDSSNGPTSAVSDDGDKDGDTDLHDDVHDDNPHDLVLHQAVCRALVNIKVSELPMATATFYAQHVIPHRPPDTTIELKLTTWKKFGTYLEDQVDCELITVMPHGTNPMGYLTGIDRKHMDLRGIKKDKTSKTQTTKLQVVNLYIIPHHFTTKLRLDEDAVKAGNAKSEQRRGTGMITVPEARAILEQYVTDNELNLSSGEVRLDGALTDVLYKKQNEPPETLSRKDLNQKWIDKMEPAFALVDMPDNYITKLGRGKVPRVSIEVSLRQGRKFITRLRGLEEFDVDPVAFTKDISKRFACSGAVDTDAVGREALKKGHVELVFQGHLVEELRALLLGDERLTSHGGAKKSDYCLPKTVIDVVLKKGVPAKKPK